MSSKKKYKMIPIIAASSAVAIALATAVPIAVIQAQKNGKGEDTKKDKKVTPVSKENFEWDSTGKIIQGFKAGVDIESLIDENNKLGLPECDEIAAQAFSFAFENVSKTFEICFQSSSLKVIGDNAFFGNEKINGFCFIDKTGVETKAALLNSIGKCAFEKTGLTKIVIPATCSEIGERAFYKCSSLATIDLGERSNLLKNVGDHAFQDLANTTDCKLVVGSTMRPETANAIAANLSTHEWGGVTFGDSNWKIFQGENPIELTKTIPTLYLNINDSYILKAGVKCGTISDYEALYVPSEVKEIDAYAFANNHKLNALTFENNSQCTTIGVRAFYECENLCSKNLEKDLTMPGSLTTIGWQAFLNCSSVKKLDFSKVVYDNRSRSFAVGTEVFVGWRVGTAEDPNTYVGPSVEEGSQSEEEVQNMFKHALSETGSLNDTWIVMDTNPMSAEEFKNRSELKEFQVVGDETYEYHLVSFNWEGVEQEGFNSLKIELGSPDEPVVIDPAAFWDEETQTTKIPDTIKTIDMSKSYVKEIGENAFRSSNIQSVIFSDTTETIGDGAFQDCKKLNGVSLPASLQTIGANAFKGCDNAYYLDFSKLSNDQLKEIITKQNNGEKAIGDDAFKDFGILQEAGGSIIWPADITEEVKNGIVNILIGAGLPETWVKEDVGKSGYTGGIPESYNGNSILVITHDEMAQKFILQSINWSALEDYVNDVEERTGVEVTSLPLIIPSYVTDIANNFWGSPSSTRLSIVNKLSFANNSKCTTIGTNAFLNATNFTGDLNIPTGVTSIQSNAFGNCTGFDGILTLPNTLNMKGVATTAFNNITTFKTINVSSWDDEYVSSFDAGAGTCPLCSNVFVNFTKETFVQTNDQLTSTNLDQVKKTLFDVAKLPSETFGTEISKYTSQIPTIDISSGLTEEYKVIDDDDKKKAIAEKYIDLINEGATIEGKEYSGVEILTNDLMLTFKNAAVNSPALASSNPSINIRLTNVDVSGESISFDIVGNINVYSDTYKYGYVSQFATQVKDLKIDSVDQLPSHDITQTAKQIGIVLTTDESTVFTTSYDKQYVYGTSDDGTSYKKVAFDLTNKSYEFKNLDGKFTRGGVYQGSTSTAAKLHEAARQAFFAAPSLTGLLFGAYDYGAIYTLNNGYDENGCLYTPYVQTYVQDNKLWLTYTPLTAKMASTSFANYNVYGKSENQTTGSKIYTTNIQNFNNTITDHAEASLTSTQAMSDYIDHIIDESSGYSPDEGQLFREEILNGYIVPLRKQIAAIANDYKYMEECTIDFVNLPGQSVITRDGSYLYANFGINIKIFLHDDVFVKDGVDTGGNPVSAYKHSYQIYIPLTFENVKLNGGYNMTTGGNGLSWSIFDTAGGRTSTMTLGSTDGLMGPYIQELTYNEQTKLFGRVLSYDMAGTYNYAAIYNDIKEMTDKSQIEEYMKTKWPLLTTLSLIHADRDNSGALNISLGYESKYLSKVTVNW